MEHDEQVAVNMGDNLIFSMCSTNEAAQLVEKYHYSKRMPSGIQYCFALREEGGLFGDYGDVVASCILGNPVNRFAEQGTIELLRLVRREDCNVKLSYLISMAIKWLKLNAKINYILSYADFSQGHHGGIYQASNFLFCQENAPCHTGFETIEGDFIHRRSCYSLLGTSSVDKVKTKRPNWKPVFGDKKFLYIYPFGKRKKFLKNTKFNILPYPKPKYDQSH